VKKKGRKEGRGESIISYFLDVFVCDDGTLWGNVRSSMVF
jgi:hypothetical protein